MRDDALGTEQPLDKEMEVKGTNIRRHSIMKHGEEKDLTGKLLHARGCIWRLENEEVIGS